jgi:predicted RND superfamily exporter protein
MMKHAGVAITITSFTSLFSFALSATTSLPALSQFCGFASFGIFFNYFNQVTMFAACVVLDEKRMKKNCGDFCGLCLCPPTSVICCYGKVFADKDGNEKESFVRKFFKEKYGPFLMKTPVKITAVVLFLALLAVNIYGAT